MKKNYKRLIALIGSALLVSSMGICSFASTLSGGKAGEPYTSENEGQKIDNTVVFKKELLIYNTTDDTSVHNPNVTYTYTIAAADLTTAKTVKDGDGDLGNVYAGVPAAITASTLAATFSSADSTVAGTKGAIASKDLSVTFNPDGFGHAGIFRYLITEGDNSAARAAAGVARKGTETTRFLDVYVRKAVETDSVSTEYVIYGYVLSKANDTKDEYASTKLGLDTKTNGFVPDYDAATGAITSGDYYNTYNLKVAKNVNGTLADKNENFPFGIAFADAPTALPVVNVDSTHQHGTYNATSATFAADGTLAFGDGTASSVLKMRHGDYIYIYGIPADAKSTVTELNSSYDIYTADITTTAISGGTASHTTVTLQPADSTSVNTVKGTNESTTNTITAGDLLLTLTNTISIVSPTGVALRFAPYILMLGAGLVILLIGKKEEEKE